jgi:hypothetical protein
MLKDTNRICSYPEYKVCAQAPSAASGDSYTYLWQDGSTDTCIVVSKTNNYKVIVTNQFGCKSVDSTTIIVDPSPDLDLGNDTFFCQGLNVRLDSRLDSTKNSIIWSNGANSKTTSVNTPGIYSAIAFDLVNFCPAQDTVVVTLRQITIDSIFIVGSSVFCEEDSVLIGTNNLLGVNLWYMNYTFISQSNFVYTKSSGIYKLQILNNGCENFVDSVFIYSYPKTYSIINHAICEGDTFLNRTISGTYIDTLVGANSKGCDSIRTLNLTVNPITYSIFNQVICSGDTFLNRTTSGTYIDTLKNSNSKGCDSIRTLNLAVNPKTYSTINQTICEGDTFLNRTTSGTYIDTLIGANIYGCDSIRTLILTVNPKTYSTLNQTICEGDTFLNRTISGTYVDTLVGANSKGCDSIRTLKLMVNPKTYATIHQIICLGQTYLGRTTSGTYIDTLIGSNIYGCDSIRTLNLTVNPKTYSTINKVICTGDKFLNKTISGTYIDTLVGANSKGCDSIRTLNLTVNPKTYSTINQTICLGQTYLGRTTSGTYIDTLKNANNKGCDSIRILNLTVIDKPFISGVISGLTTVCQGQSNISYSVIEASNNPTKYNWSLPNGFNGVSNTNKIPVNILSNAISGILTVMSENTCGNSNLLSLPVIVNPKPQKPIISNNGNSLISSSLNGNQWYDLNGLIAGANNTVYIGTPNNSYYVLVTENGCISDPSNIISLSSSEVVELLNKGIKIYPNPFSELLNIEVSHKDHIEYLLTTVDGKVINKDKFKEHYKIDTKKLASGTYFLIIKDKDQYESFKIIKK